MCVYENKRTFENFLTFQKKSFTAHTEMIKRIKQIQCVITPCQADFMVTVRVAFAVTAANMMDVLCLCHLSVTQCFSQRDSPSRSQLTINIRLDSSLWLLTHKRCWWNLSQTLIKQVYRAYDWWCVLCVICCEIWSVLLLNAEPREPPSEVQAFAISSSEIKVMWKPPNPGPGRPQGYEVRKGEMNRYMVLCQDLVSRPPRQHHVVEKVGKILIVYIHF